MKATPPTAVSTSIVLVRPARRKATTASARSASRWVFRVAQTEPLELPAGTITALKLQRVPEDEHDQRADLWLAPSVHYLPVRLRITQSSGDFVDLRLKETSAP